MVLFGLNSVFHFYQEYEKMEAELKTLDAKLDEKEKEEHE